MPDVIGRLRASDKVVRRPMQSFDVSSEKVAGRCWKEPVTWYRGIKVSSIKTYSKFSLYFKIFLFSSFWATTSLSQSLIPYFQRIIDINEIFNKSKKSN